MENSTEHIASSPLPPEQQAVILKAETTMDVNDAAYIFNDGTLIKSILDPEIGSAGHERIAQIAFPDSVNGVSSLIDTGAIRMNFSKSSQHRTLFLEFHHIPNIKQLSLLREAIRGSDSFIVDWWLPRDIPHAPDQKDTNMEFTYDGVEKDKAFANLLREIRVKLSAARQKAEK